MKSFKSLFGLLLLLVIISTVHGQPVLSERELATAFTSAATYANPAAISAVPITASVPVIVEPQTLPLPNFDIDFNNGLNIIPHTEPTQIPAYPLPDPIPVLVRPDALLPDLDFDFGTEEPSVTEPTVCNDFFTSLGNFIVRIGNLIKLGFAYIKLPFVYRGPDGRHYRLVLEEASGNPEDRYRASNVIIPEEVQNQLDRAFREAFRGALAGF